MTKTTKRLLGISIGCLALGLVFVTGIINAEAYVAAYVILPLGAVFFGLFLISRMLEKESALYDEEQQAHPALAKVTAKTATKDCDCGRATKAPARA